MTSERKETPLLLDYVYVRVWVQLYLIGAIRCCHVMYKLLYPSIRVRIAPPVSVRVRVRVSVSFGFTV